MTARIICGIIFMLMLTIFLAVMIATEYAAAKARKVRKNKPGVMLPTVPQDCIDALRARAEGRDPTPYLIRHKTGKGR